MAPTNKRTARARKNHTLQFLSRKPFFVTRQTPRAPDASHSLKPANFPLRGPHTWQGVKALLGASRRLSQLISAAYGWQPQKPAKINHPIDFLNNWPPSIENPKIPQIVTIVHNSKLLRIVKNCYKMLRNVTKCQMLRIVTKCYEMLRNVTICNNSTFVLEYACTIENDSHSQAVHQYYSPLYPSSRTLYDPSRTLYPPSRVLYISSRVLPGFFIALHLPK